MDNQKSQTGNGSNFNKDSSGNQLHKDAGNHMGSTGGNKGAMGSDASKQFDNAKSSDQNKSTDMNKGTEQHKGSEQKSAVTNNAFDSKPEQNKQFDQSKSSDLTKSSDASKPVEFPKAGMASASTASSASTTGSTASSYDSTSKPADLSARTDSAHKSIDKALDAAQPMADRLATSAHAGVDKVSNALTGASARMEDKTKQLSEAYQHFADSGRQYVRSSPATSVLVALAAGYTLSKLFGRR